LSLRSRRSFLRAAFFGALSLGAAGSVAGLFNYLYPWGRRDAARVKAGNVRDYLPGSDPVRFEINPAVALIPGNRRAEHGFWLVHLDPDDERPSGSGGESGFVALADYCTHLHCTVPWRPKFTYENSEGWFRCPCHGATFTRAGARVFGPAPRGLDSHPIEIAGDGTIRVDLGRIVEADERKPGRGALPPRHLGLS
jgi:cytochrome b6-f complex iron-sulfur subunit